MRDITAGEQRRYRGKSRPPEGLQVSMPMQVPSNSSQHGPREFRPGLLDPSGQPHPTV